MDKNLNELKELFIDKIEAESATRKKQLSDLQVIFNMLDSNAYKLAFMKITVPEFYAQYEGFFKFLFREIISYLNKINIDNSGINVKYFIFSLLTNIDENITNQKKRAKKMLSIFNDVSKENKSFLSISNFDNYILNLDSTKHTLDILGIDSYKVPMASLDLLYKRRCEIAHGNISKSNPFYISSDMDVTDHIVDKTYNDFWLEHYGAVIFAIETLSDLFIDYISSEVYKAV